MDINQKYLKSLVDKTDVTFQQYKRHPESKDHGQAYEEAKFALEQYLIKLRLSMQQKGKKR